ncbi:cortex morphogenetic protein CmpA [Alkalihalobacillus sp. MEB130]|nr:cortex morphogenetic protein CmpA [Alkalihalobacillus sp. MEB130]MDT8862720.1 cortex morphogenetic protein CmpA [Alkalihalobacillus sp. MEB130]
MPTWLREQLKRAYQQKDRYQIKILNQCWFYYKEKEDTDF